MHVYFTQDYFFIRHSMSIIGWWPPTPNTQMQARLVVKKWWAPVILIKCISLLAERKKEWAIIFMQFTPKKQIMKLHSKK